MDLFSKDKVNTGRQQEADLARGMSVILMILCHVGLYIGDPSDKALYCFSDIIGSEWCAPVFMSLMGLGIVYSRHQEPRYLLRRGAVLFAAGYGLSFFRTLLPLLILGDIDVWTQFDSFFVVDILQFAGLSFMFLALLRKLGLSSLKILILSVIMVGIGQVMMVHVCPYADKGPVSYLANLFFPVTEWSCFPFFTWFFFPAFGLCLGEALVRCRDKDRLYRIVLPVSFCGVLFVYILFILLYPDYTSYYFGGNFYYMGIGNAVLTAAFICFSLSFWHYAGRILYQPVKRYLGFLSRNTNIYYVLSWLVISAVIHIKAYFCLEFSTAGTVILMMAVVVLCSFLTSGAVRIRKAVCGRSAENR